MAVSLRASKEGLQKIDAARKKKGWTKTEDAWWGLALTSRATLKRFWRNLPIERDAFIGICKNVGVNWEEIVDDKVLVMLPRVILWRCGSLRGKFVSNLLMVMWWLIGKGMVKKLKRWKRLLRKGGLRG